MKRPIVRMERVYVRVNSDFDSTGLMQPKSITWTNGRVYKIDSIRDYRPAGTNHDSLTCDMYTVVVMGELKHLFFERTSRYQKSCIGRWYVECPVKA